MFQVIVKFAGSLWFIENYNTAIALTKRKADASVMSHDAAFDLAYDLAYEDAYALDIVRAYMLNVDTLELTHV